MGFGQKYLKLKELMGIRNLPFCQKLSKKFFSPELKYFNGKKHIRQQNTCTFLRAHLSDETFSSSRRLKEYTHQNKSAHNIYTLDKEILSNVQHAHLMYDQHKHEEKMEIIKLVQAEKGIKAKEKAQKEALGKAENASSSINSQERAFSAEKRKLMNSFCLKIEWLMMHVQG